jgi:SAM-dependent methyltransferase
VTAAARRHFAGVAAHYQQLRERWPLGAVRAEEQRALRELVAVAAGQRVLDVGCGDGTTLAWLQGLGARAVGVDAVWGMAALARRSGAPTVVQDMEALGISARFDWVLCVGALEFTADPAAAIAALAACVQPGGRLALLFPRRSLLGRLYAAYHRRNGLRIHLFTPAAMRGHLTAAGLSPLPPWRDCALSTVCVAERRGDGA